MTTTGTKKIEKKKISRKKGTLNVHQTEKVVLVMTVFLMVTGAVSRIRVEGDDVRRKRNKREKSKGRKRKNGREWGEKGVTSEPDLKLNSATRKKERHIVGGDGAKNEGNVTIFRRAGVSYGKVVMDGRPARNSKQVYTTRHPVETEKKGDTSRQGFEMKMK